MSFFISAGWSASTSSTALGPAAGAVDAFIKQGKLAGENMAGGNERFGKAQEDFFWVLFGHPLTERSK